MRVYWSTLSGCLGSDVTSYRQIRRLLERVAEGKHELVYGFLDFEPFFESDLFLNHLSSYEQNQLREAFERLANSRLVEDPTASPMPIGQRPAGFHAELVGKRLASAMASDDCLWTLTPLDVGDWADRPLEIILENMADFVLLKCFARVSSQSGRHERLSLAIARGWFSPFHAGGCGEIIKHIDDFLKKHNHVARLIVLMDSDHDLHTQSQSKTATDTKTHCDGHKIKCLVTQRHEIENYIPICLLQKKINGCGQAKKQLSNDLEKLLKATQSNLCPPYTYEQLWQHHLGLDSQHRHRDDLKARFGEKWMQAALQMLGDERELNDVRQFDSEAQAELGGWAQTIEAYL